MKRKQAREFAVQLIYTLEFETINPDGAVKDRLEHLESLSQEDELYAYPPDEVETAYIERIVQGVAEHLAELDAYIEKYAVGWRFGRIPRVAVAVMRVCMFEVLYMHDVPPKAAMNEAIEIAKKYEPKEVVAFINGIIGSFHKGEIEQQGEQ
jgi:N utilization substance protein B